MVYVDLVMALNFAVDLLLLVGANGLSGYPPDYGRFAAAAGVGGIYGGICLLPGFRFMGSTLWRLVFLGLMAVIAFGFNRSVISRGGLFFLLSMALGGIAFGLGRRGAASLIAAAGGLMVLCVLGFSGGNVGQKLRKVELVWKGNRRILLALHDTGNLLRDPATGLPVLVVGANVAWELFGLTSSQLASPVETMLDHPGFRLIPYRSVGQGGGMLLGRKMDEIRIDGKLWSGMVAFSSQGFENVGYEALTGGVA